MAAARSTPASPLVRPAPLTRLVVGATAAAVTVTAGLAGTAGAQPDDPGITTTTQPVSGGSDLGRIVKRPNSGVAPSDAGDPGGWLQVSLFFIVCAVLIGVTLFLWHRSRKIRAAQAAAGHDRVTLARAHAHGRGPRSAAS